MNDREITILLIDDDEAAREGIRRLFKKNNVPVPLIEAEGGEEGLGILRNAAQSGEDKHFLVLLDINMPKMNGFEFLDILRAEPLISQTVVFMFTTSSQLSDIKQAYEKNVAGYIVKSGVGEGFKEILDLLNAYTKYVSLPKL